MTKGMEHAGVDADASLLPEAESGAEFVGDLRSTGSDLEIDRPAGGFKHGAAGTGISWIGGPVNAMDGAQGAIGGEYRPVSSGAKGEPEQGLQPGQVRRCREPDQTGIPFSANRRVYRLASRSA